MQYVMGIPARVLLEMRAHISSSTRNKWVLVHLKMEYSEQEMRNRVRPQLDQVCLLHGVRIEEKGNREVAELDLHVLEIENKKITMMNLNLKFKSDTSLLNYFRLNMSVYIMIYQHTTRLESHIQYCESQSSKGCIPIQFLTLNLANPG